MPSAFAAAWRGLAARRHWDARLAEAWLADLVSRYGEPARAYHTATHVEDLLGRLRTLPLARPDEATMAAFFHDAIYGVGARDNEALSAALAHRTLEELGERGDVAAQVAAMCTATATHAATGDADTDMFLDADMAVLGDPPLAYRRYQDAMRREYLTAFSPPEYAEGRIALFIDPTLARERIFLTPSLEEREAQARQNLIDERDWLARPA